MIDRLGWFFMIGLLFISLPVFAEETISIGTGFGALYGGLGANVALVGDHDMKYLAGGIAAMALENDNELV